MNFLDVVIYVCAFFAIYMQVFLFVTFFQKRRSLNINKNISYLDNDLPSITFMVPCWNEEKTLDNTVLSLREIDYPKDKFFMILVNDGSKDKTWEIMQKYKDDPQIKILTQENAGKHSALNNALSYANTELVASIDADTVIKKDALKKAVVYFLENKELSSLGCSVFIKTPKSFVQKAQSVEYQMFSFSKRMLGFLGGVLVAPGAFSIFKRETLSKIGGWTDGNGLEDLELTYRLQTNNYKVEHCHTAVAYTAGPQTLRKLFKQRLRWAYGFLRSTYDYRHVIFNRKYGNFGFYTIPTSLLSYIIILSIFFISWYRIFNFLYEKIIMYNLIGWNALFRTEFSSEWFFINTKAIVFITIISFAFIILNVFLGRKISNIRDRKYGHMVYFFLIYSIVLPFWILRSVVNAIFSFKPSWR